MCVEQNYIHKVPVILHDSLERESLKPYSPSTPVKWLQLLRKQTNTGTSIILVAETDWLIDWYTLNLPTWGISLGSVMLPALEAGDFVEFLLLYEFYCDETSHFPVGETGRFLPRDTLYGSTQPNWKIQCVPLATELAGWRTAAPCRNN